MKRHRKSTGPKSTVPRKRPQDDSQDDSTTPEANSFPLDRLPIELLQCVRDHLSVRDHKSLALVSTTTRHNLIRSLLLRTATRAAAGLDMSAPVRANVRTLLVNEAVSDAVLDTWRRVPITTLIVSDQQPKPEAANEPIFYRPPKGSDSPEVSCLYERVNRLKLPQSVGQPLTAALDRFLSVFRSPNEARYTHSQLIRLLDLICRCRLSASELSDWVRSTAHAAHTSIRGKCEGGTDGTGNGDSDDGNGNSDDDDDFEYYYSNAYNDPRVSVGAHRALNTLIAFATFVELHSPPAVERCYKYWPRMHSGHYLKMFIDDRAKTCRPSPRKPHLARLLDSADRIQLIPRLTDSQFFRAYQPRPIASALETVAATVEYVIMDVRSMGYPRIGFPYNLMLPELRVLVNNDYGFEHDHMDMYFRTVWKHSLLTCPGQVPNLGLIALGHDPGLADPRGLYHRLLAAAKAGGEQAVVDVLVRQPRIQELLITGRADCVVVRCRPDTVLPPDIKRDEHGEPYDCFALLYVWIPTGTIVGVMRSSTHTARYRRYVTRHHRSIDTGGEAMDLEDFNKFKADTAREFNQLRFEILECSGALPARSFE